MVDVDVCIVGAGQCGLALAKSLIDLSYFPVVFDMDCCTENSIHAGISKHDGSASPKDELRVVVLESNQEPSGSWLRRWPSLRLFSPLQYSLLDGTSSEEVMRFEESTDDSAHARAQPPGDYFPSSTAIGKSLVHSASKWGIGVRCGHRCKSICRVRPQEVASVPDDTSFELIVEAGQGKIYSIFTRKVVLATGSFRKSKIPVGFRVHNGVGAARFARASTIAPAPFDGVLQFTAGDYHGAMPVLSALQTKQRQLEDAQIHDDQNRDCNSQGDIFRRRATESSRKNVRSTIVVVGAGATGVSIAHDIASTVSDEPIATRPRIVLVGRDLGSLPRRVFGKDVYFWLDKLGMLDIRRTSLVGSKIASSVWGKGDILVGDMLGNARRAGVEYIANERVVEWALEERGLLLAPSNHVLSDVDVVIWACGFKPALDEYFDGSGAFGAESQHLENMFDEDGYPLPESHDSGISNTIQGLYFVGLRFLTASDSSLLHGASRDAQVIAKHIIDSLKNQLSQN